MKKMLLSLVLMLVMAFSVFLTGCSPKGLEDNPDTNALVISNGGTTIVKGDYLYYINGYVDETTLTVDDNDFGDISHGAIYRTKLVDGSIEKNKDGFVVKTECVVPKVVGFSNGGFYIVDDYIYYTTPNMNYDRDGKIQTARVEFHRIKIDGTKDEEIYSPANEQTELDWTVYKVDGTVYIATFIGGKIIIVNTDTEKVVTEVESSTSYAFHKEFTYDANKSRNLDSQRYIYFTRDIDRSNIAYLGYKGNEVCKLNIATGDVETLLTSDTYKYVINKVNDRNIYFTKRNGKTSGISLTLLYRKPLNKMNDNGIIVNSWKSSEEVIMSEVAYDNYMVSDVGDDLVVASSSQAGREGVYVVSNRVNHTRVLSSSQTIVAINNGYAYYINENKLYRFDIDGELENGSIKVDEVTDVENTYLITNKNYFDFYLENVYVYRTYTSASNSTATYMNYIDNSFASKFVGNFKDSDKPAKPEQKEDYKEGGEIPYTPWID